MLMTLDIFQLVIYRINRRRKEMLDRGKMEKQSIFLVSGPVGCFLIFFRLPKKRSC